MDPDYDRNVFINCPFDAAYAPIFEALVFAVSYMGFFPRSALQRLDSSEIRLQKIIELIRMSRYSIHDLSRTELDDTTTLPRFNMPLELGIDLGCKAFSRAHARKSFLIFDSEQYRFQKYLSDIGGQDVHRHGNDPKLAVIGLRDWLRTEVRVSDVPGGAAVYDGYLQFRHDLPGVAASVKLDPEHLPFIDYTNLISIWLRNHT